MHRGVIIGRMRPGAKEADIIKAFGKSDQTELPHLAGVKHRSVFILGDIYVHLVEGDKPLGGIIPEFHQHPLFIEVKAELDQCVEPLSLDLYPGVGRHIYSWDAEIGREDGGNKK